MAPCSTKRRRSSARVRCCRTDYCGPTIVRRRLRRADRERDRFVARLLSPVPAARRATRLGRPDAHVRRPRSRRELLRQHSREPSRVRHDERSPTDVRRTHAPRWLRDPRRVRGALRWRNGGAAHRGSISCTHFSKARKARRDRFGRTSSTRTGARRRRRPGRLRSSVRASSAGPTKAVRPADRRRRREGVGLRPRPEPGDRAQARRGARRDAGGAARRRQRAREEFHARRGRRGRRTANTSTQRRSRRNRSSRASGWASSTTCRAGWS